MSHAIPHGVTFRERLDRFLRETGTTPPDAQVGLVISRVASAHAAGDTRALVFWSEVLAELVIIRPAMLPRGPA